MADARDGQARHPGGMTPTIQRGGPGGQEHPRTGYAAGVVALVAMGIVAIASWDRLPGQIVTDLIGARGSESTVPRGLAVSLMPIALGILLALMTLVPMWNRWVERTPVRSGVSPAGRKRVLDLLIIALSGLLLGLHIGLIGSFTGDGPTIMQTASFGLGLVTTVLAVVVLVQVRAGGRYSAAAPLWAALVGAAGVAGVALSFIAAEVGMVVAGTAVVIGAILIGADQAFARVRLRSDGSED